MPRSPSVAAIAARLRAFSPPFARALRDTEEGMGPTESSVFGTILRHGPIMLSDLAARERLSAPTISRVVNGLDRAGLVERRPDEHDRRVCYVAVTDAGLDVVRAGRATRDAWLAGRLRSLTKDELATLAAALPLLERLIAEEG